MTRIEKIRNYLWYGIDQSKKFEDQYYGEPPLTQQEINDYTKWKFSEEHMKQLRKARYGDENFVDPHESMGW
jgi:hypothetical protein